MTDRVLAPLPIPAVDAARFATLLEETAAIMHAACLGFLSLGLPADTPVTPAEIERLLRQKAAASDQVAKDTLGEIAARTSRGTCRHCDEPIVRMDAQAWFHGEQIPEFESGFRGCRSYSFELLGDWDDSLKRSWYAQPA